MDSHNLTPEQQAMVKVWERHLAAEFKDKDIDATMATMNSDPFVNHVPVMTGGVGYPNIHYLILGGLGSEGHLTGEALKALIHHGVDENGVTP